MCGPSPVKINSYETLLLGKKKKEKANCKFARSVQRCCYLILAVISKLLYKSSIKKLPSLHIVQFSTNTFVIKDFSGLL